MGRILNTINWEEKVSVKGEREFLEVSDEEAACGQSGLPCFFPFEMFIHPLMFFGGNDEFNKVF